MSSTAEMSALVHEAASYAGSENWKDRVGAAARSLGISFGRAKRHYYGEARSVDAEEMDQARAAIEELREARNRARADEHLAWLRQQIEQHRSSGDELRGPHVDALEHLLRMAGGEAGALAVRPASVGHASRAARFSAAIKAGRHA